MYLEIDEGFISHRKTLRFCGLMQDQNAFAYLLRLWSWATRSAPDGKLTGMDPMDLEIAVQYRLMDGKCFRAMVAAGFVDTDADGNPTEIHNWGSRTGGSIARMVDNAERKKAIRLHRDGKCGGSDECKVCDGTIKLRSEDKRETVPGHSQDNGGTSAGHEQGKLRHFDTVQTSPDQSRPDLKAPPPARKRDPWPSWHWYNKFAAAWQIAHASIAYGRGDDDYEATGELDDKLNSLPGDQRLAAEDAAEALFARYFAIRAAAPGHPWKWFVQRFNELRTPPAARGSPRPRDVSVGSIPAPGPEFKYAKGEQPL